MKVVISGYYGFDNAGDEAVLAAILTGLREQCHKVRPVVLSAAPERTADRWGVEAVPRLSLPAVRRAIRGAALFISGGGTLLQDATGWGSVPYYGGLMVLARRLGVPVFVYAQGLGPLRRRSLRGLAGRALAAADFVTVRDAASAALCRDLGVNPARVHLTADPVFTFVRGDGAVIGPQSPAHGITDAGRRLLASLPEGPLVGISLRSLPGGGGPEAAERLLDGVTRALRAAMPALGARIVPLPLHPPQDGPVLDRLVAGLGPLAAPWPAAVEPAALAPSDWIAVFERMELCVTMRLHGLIFAACAGVPAVAVGTDPKLAAHVDELGLPRERFLLGGCAGLSDVLAALWPERRSWRRRILDQAAVLKERARETAARALAVAQEAVA